MRKRMGDNINGCKRISKALLHLVGEVIQRGVHDITL